MGSRTTPHRNSKDSIVIREPITSISTGRSSRQDRIAEICEISFHVKLKESPLTKRGIPVTLRKAGTVYEILVLGSIVGNLTLKQSAMIDTCASLDVRYVGKIVKESNGIYAQFTRIVR